MAEDPLWRRFEEYHDKHLSLLREHRFVDAARIWKDAAAEFEAAGSSEHAATAIGFAGSAYSCAQNDHKALSAYKRAIELAPSDPLHHLTVGRFLLDVSDEPEAALEEIDIAINLAAKDPQTSYCLPEALGLLGIAWLRLGRIHDANNLFQNTCRAAAAGPSNPTLDLRLASEYAKRGEFLKECAQFAADAVEWASVTSNDDMLARVKNLRESIETGA